MWFNLHALIKFIIKAVHKWGWGGGICGGCFVPIWIFLIHGVITLFSSQIDPPTHSETKRAPKGSSKHKGGICGSGRKDTLLDPHNYIREKSLQVMIRTEVPRIKGWQTSLERVGQETKMPSFYRGLLPQPGLLRFRESGQRTGTQAERTPRKTVWLITLSLHCQPPTPAPAHLPTAEKGEQSHWHWTNGSQWPEHLHIFLLIRAFQTISGMPSRSQALSRPGMKLHPGPVPQGPQGPTEWAPKPAHCGKCPQEEAIPPT